MHIHELTRAMQDFVASKGWQKTGSPRPQTPRNLAVSLCLESAEVLEHFQWSDHVAEPDSLPGELADVALYLLQLANVAGVDLEKAILEKLDQNYSRNWDQDDVK